ncbi:MAG: OsmC family peroxiredoxin [Anaerolineae bacterium]|nr:OsmC family peroxiredoxin [Anaerolineae bacterium]
MPTRIAEATWQGTLKEGSGSVKLGSGAYEGPFSYVSRFETGSGTNPEELLGAAEAGCFTMALNLRLFQNGFTPNHIHTTAHVQMDKTEAGNTIVNIHLVVEGSVPGISAEDFAVHAAETSKGCIISRAISAPITVAAKLV